MTYTNDFLWAHPHYAASYLERTQYGQYGDSSHNTGPQIDGDAYVRTGETTSPFWRGHGFRELVGWAREKQRVGVWLKLTEEW